MAINKQVIAVTGILLASAQLGGVFAAPIGNGVMLGDSGVKAYPWLKVDFVHEDNYFRTSGDIIQEKSTWINVIEPGVRLSALKGADAYNLSYLARIGTVFDSKNDNFYRSRGECGCQLGIGFAPQASRRLRVSSLA